MACSNCLITQGVKPNCTVKQPGGLQFKFYLIPKCHVAAFADANADNVIESLSLVAGMVFYQFVANKDSVTVSETLTLPNRFVLQKFEFTLTNINDNANAELGAQQATDALQELVNSDEPLVLILTDRSGIRRVYGKTNGLEIAAAEKSSGSAIADVAGAKITLEAGEPAYAPVLAASYVIPL